MLRSSFIAVAIGWALAGQSAAQTTAATVDEKSIGLYQQAPGDWLSNGRTYAEQRYSPLARVDAGNVCMLRRTTGA
jgi:glucose dehydrogenase